MYFLYTKAIFLYQKLKNTNYQNKATDFSIIIGTEITPAVLKPSKKRYKIDGVEKYYEKLRLIPLTVLLIRGYPIETIHALITEAKNHLSDEEYALLLESGGLLPLTI